MREKRLVEKSRAAGGEDTRSKMFSATAQEWKEVWREVVAFFCIQQVGRVALGA